MKSKFLFGALLGSIALASCTADEELNSPAVSQESPIKFAVSLEGSDGIFYPLAGVIPDKAWKTNRLGRFGYITLTPDHPDVCLTGEIKGHEFHYWESGDCGTCWTAKKPLSDRSWSCIHSEQGQITGFPHLYYPSAPEFAERWLETCRKWQKR